MTLKNLIKNNFENSANTYDNVAQIQQQSSQILIDMISENIKSVLDIGCGTGHTSLKMFEKYPNAEYTLCDLSQNMLDVAKKKFSTNITTICCDAENYKFKKHYDIGISNLCVQWFYSLENFLDNILNYCDNFAFSTLQKSSFATYKTYFDVSPTFAYPTNDELSEICKKFHTTKTASQHFELQFENKLAVSRYFKQLGANLKSTNNAKWKGNITPPITVDYDIFFAIIKR